MIFWVMKIFFLQFCVFLPPLLNIFCFCYVQTISVLYRAHLCMKCSLDSSNFLEEIFSLSHSVVFLFLCIDHWQRLSYLSLLFFGTLHSDAYLSFSPLLFASLLFRAICKASPDNHFAFLHFFSMGMVYIPVSCTMSRTSFDSSSGTLSIRSMPLNLFLTSTL